MRIPSNRFVENKQPIKLDGGFGHDTEWFPFLKLTVAAPLCVREKAAGAKAVTDTLKSAVTATVNFMVD